MTTATVFIPTWNGEDYLRAALTAVLAQDVDDAFDVLVIDSGSTDSTLAILADFPQVRVEHIDKADFGHGKTRNLAASMATGDVVAFLTQDAIPADDQWLRRLIEALEISPDVWGVFGRQIPRDNCPPLQRYEILGAFAASGIDIGVTLQSAAWSPAQQRDRAGFYSDVNAAARRSTLVDVLPYRDVPYAEDQLFGRDVLERGKLKAYAPAAAVIHSNDVTLADYPHRMFDEGVALRRAGSTVRVGSFPVRLARVLRGSLGDALRIARDPYYSGAAKLRWWFLNPLFHWQKWRGYRWAETANLDDEHAHRRRSLEGRSASE